MKRFAVTLTFEIMSEDTPSIIIQTLRTNLAVIHITSAIAETGVGIVNEMSVDNVSQI